MEQLIKQILHDKGRIDLPSHGTSMFPLIQEGDICRFVPIHPEQGLRKGDIVLFVSEQGQLIAHRYYDRFAEDGVLYHLIKGDANHLPDPPVREAQLLGKLDLIRKKHVILNAGHPIIEAWKLLVLKMPKLSIYCKHYLSAKP